MRTYARRLNRPDEARLLQETLDEEGRTDHRLTEIAQAHVNDDARLETDFGQPRPAKRLRYVDIRQFADARLSGRTLEIRNDADDALGTFEGAIVDATTGAPRYIVVNARGLFSWRRSLLPVSLIRLDESAGVLRVPLDKDIASRYPEFDRDEFEAMDDGTLHLYEGRLLSFFPKERATPLVRPIAEGEVPEWLVASVWLTVPPGRPDPLSDEARGFSTDAGNGDRQAGAPDMTARGEGESRREPERDPSRPVTPDDAPTPPHGEKLR